MVFGGKGNIAYALVCSSDFELLTARATLRKRVCIAVIL